MDYRLYVKYLKVLVFVVVGFYGCVVTLNYLLDPFGKNNFLELDFDRQLVTKPYNDILFNLAMAKEDSYRKVIFGDSRGVALKIEFFDKREPGWFNFSMGGANMLEIISSVKYGVEEKGVKEALIVLPFRTFKDIDTNRFTGARELLDNDLLYYTNMLVSKASFASLVYISTGRVIKKRTVDGDKGLFWTNRLNHARLRASLWPEAKRILPKIEELFEFLDNRGVKFTILIPAVHADLLEIYNSEQGEDYGAYKDFLISLSPVMDCSESYLAGDYGSFKDPYHSTDEVSEVIIGEYLSKSGGLCRFVGKERQ